MTKIEIQTLYEVMFTDYPDIVNVAQVQAMLAISRHLAYAADRRRRHPRHENRQRIPRTENQCDPLRTLGGKSTAGGVAGI